MTDTTKNDTAAAPAADPAKADVLASMQASLDQTVEEFTKAEIEKIVRERARKIVNRRGEVLAGAINEVYALRRRVEAASKPDETVYDDEGNVLHEGFSAKRLERRNEYREKLAELEEAVGKALDGDFTTLFEVRNFSAENTTFDTTQLPVERARDDKWPDDHYPTPRLSDIPSRDARHLFDTFDTRAKAKY